MRLGTITAATLGLAACCTMLCASAGLAADRTRGGAAWQAAGDTAGTPPTLKVNSREVVVDVEVLDAQGAAVHGLQQSDFTVKENGREQAIRSFAESSEGALPAPPAPKLAAGTYSSYQPQPRRGPVNILLLDGLHTPCILMMRVQREVTAYLRSMPEGTEVAVFWMSQGGLHRLQEFTSDRTLLTKAVSRPLACNQIDDWQQKWITADSMDEIAMYVAGIQGRKNLLWFTPTMPVFLLRDGGYGWGEGNMGLVHRMMDAYELLSQAQVAVSPVSPVGVTILNWNTLLTEQVAEQSGGTAYYNSNNLRGLIAKAIATQANYYTLSYVPPRTRDDGHYHQISVAVNRPGLRLIYRKGYDSEDPLAAKAIAPGPGLRRAVMWGRAATGKDMQFDVSVRPSAGDAGFDDELAVAPRASRRKKAKPGVRHDFVFAVPASQIAFAAAKDGTRTASLEFDIAAYAPNGELWNVVSQKMQMTLSPEQYAQFADAPLHFMQRIDLPPGETMVRVGVLDDVSKKAGSTEIQLAVAKAATTGK